MGVPAFFSWLIKRYPLILSNAIIEEMPVIDNLYLDMNSILYKCARDEKIMFKDLLIEKNYDELWAQIFNYINNIVNTVGPTKVLFLGLDGPAPRAKQNQQRSRRFQSAKGYKELNKSLQNCGFMSSENTFKNNSISPGTEFMHELNNQLKFFIAKKYEEDDKWKNLRVVFSGSNVPGEGEHKILSYMRQYTSDQNYDPKTTHCIYGPDADLIMLGLSTHIPYVSILREVQPPSYTNKISPATKRIQEEQQFQIIYLNIVREYMDLEFSILKSKFKHLEYNIDRIIDDFILIAFFLGNDFLPKCYCFDIRQGHIEGLMDSYKEMIVESDSYINTKGKISWQAMEKLLEIMSTYELQMISEKSTQIQDSYMKGKLYKLIQDDDMCDDNDSEEEEKNDAKNSDTFGIKTDYDKVVQEKKVQGAELVKKEKDFLTELEELYKKDDIGGKKKYYQEKLGFDLEKDEDGEKLQFLLQKYVEGLQFVLQYYYFGVPSWSWYFPFYFSPMVSDLFAFVKHQNETNVSLDCKFNKSTPYEPLKSLLCILHPENYSLLPQEFSKLITDLDSPLRAPFDYFPEKIKIDPFGGVFEHEYVVELPFLDEETLMNAYNKIDMTKLSDKDKARNQIALNVVYTYDNTPNAKKIEIKSTIPFVTQSVKIPLKSLEFSLDQSIVCSTQPLKIEGFVKDKIHIFPSLYTKKFADWKFRDVHHRETPYKKLHLFLEEEIILPHVTPKQFTTVYTNYPCCDRAYIVGWMDRESLFKIKSKGEIKALTDAHYKKEDHDMIYDRYYDDCKQLQEQQGIEVLDKSDSQDKIVFLRYYNNFERTVSGSVLENDFFYDDYFYLSTAFSSTQRLKKRYEVVHFNKIEEEFPLNSKVIVFEENYLGCVGKVTGYKKREGKMKSSQIKVKLYKQPYLLSQNEANNLQRDTTSYYKLDYIAKELKLNIYIVLALLDEVVIIMDEDRESSNKLKKRLDIGLKFISRYQNMIVPELVRLPDGLYGASEIEGRQKFEQFTRLEISRDGTDILRKYYDKIKNTKIFGIMKKQIENRQKVKIHVNDVFNVDLKKETKFDPNIEMVQIYIWVLQNCQANLALCPVNAQVISIKNLLRNYTSKKPHYSKQINDEKLFDPNFLQRECEYFYVPMYYKDHPFGHQVGDRVINVNSIVKPNVPPFGAIGTIVGVMDKQVQVIFDEPFIGGTNLGGKCNWLTGATLDFLDVFNLEGGKNNTWAKYLVPRDDKNHQYGWNRIIMPFVPEYRNKAIANSEQNQKLSEKFKIQNPLKDVENVKGDFEDDFQQVPLKGHHQKHHQKKHGEKKEEETNVEDIEKMLNNENKAEESKDDGLDLEELEKQLKGDSKQQQKQQQQQQKKQEVKKEQQKKVEQKQQQEEEDEEEFNHEDLEKQLLAQQESEYQKQQEIAFNTLQSLNPNKDSQQQENKEEKKGEDNEDDNAIDVAELEKQL